MNKLYYNDCHYSTPDHKAEEEALALNNGDVYTSSKIVLLAAMVLLKEGKLKPFSVKIESESMTLDEDGFPDLLVDKYLNRIISSN